MTLSRRFQKFLRVFLVGSDSRTSQRSAYGVFLIVAYLLMGIQLLIVLPNEVPLALDVVVDERVKGIVVSNLCALVVKWHSKFAAFFMITARLVLKIIYILLTCLLVLCFKSWLLGRKFV